MSTILSFGQTTRDSLVYTPITKAITHDTIVKVAHDTTYVVRHDSSYKSTHDTSYVKVDTIKVIVPPSNVVLKGIYGHPDQVTIGNSTSENKFLTWAKREGANMINMYARAFLYTSSNRDLMAAFVKKAKEQYGMLIITVDVRMTDSREYPGWQAYFAKYANTISSIEALTEFEPYTNVGTSSNPIYDYPGFFNLVSKMGPLCKQNNSKLNYYEGWVGNNYSNPQAAVDSMVKYCDRIFVSNYISVSDYNSTSSSLGAWDARMDKRLNPIAVSCPKFGKPYMEIVEIVSLEPNFLFSIYACPATSTNKCNAFFGPLYDKAVTAYKLSTVDALKYTRLIGRTMFYSKYAQQAHP